MSTTARRSRDAAGDDTAEPPPYLEVDQVRKRFPQKRPIRDVVRAPLARRYVDALRGMTFSVGMGEFYGLLGANGAGKTTLMKIIATLIAPDAGHVRVGGLDVERNSTAVRSLVSIALASERGLFWRLSAWENLRLFAELNAVPVAEAGDRIASAIETVGLTDARARMVREFSSGMMQRLLIARALITEPQLLLLDEPTRSLDPISAREFRRFLREELAVRRQCAVLLATHDADEAFNLCDRVAILDRGAIVAEGTAHELAFDVFGSQHVLTTDAPNHPVLDALAGRAMLEILSVEQEPGAGWSKVRLRIPGGEAEASQVLRDAVAGGLNVAAFSRETRSLADLIEGVIARGRLT